MDIAWERERKSEKRNGRELVVYGILRANWASTTRNRQPQGTPHKLHQYKEIPLCEPEERLAPKGMQKLED